MSDLICGRPVADDRALPILYTITLVSNLVFLIGDVICHCEPVNEDRHERAISYGMEMI